MWKFKDGVFEEKQGENAKIWKRNGENERKHGLI